MADTLRIRDAEADDLPVILSIYNDAVQHTTAIWNERLVDLADRRAWWEDKIAKGHPVLVAERGGEILGYATYGQWRVIDGFRATMEHSVYVRADRPRSGTGTALMGALIDTAKARGVHVLIACIEAENAASIGLHGKLGFRTVGTFREAGRKFDRWLDLTCMELPLTGA
ncbi:GNAT family N-acetyltransferase [Falsirhodobacter algicola]|uniref:GNAT family N-acetyltransferase n=1 Tax=Falsirhodobacter algicola TaxID=2692330 RepID=A0A8J8SLD1_9RHOB|nr:GNAT family N-acetyltransferase [Falsirhodobacter algicola]QUS36357.1 GNAT family N-acetyltransferase [Falsirhodobacter algicola]